MNLRMRSPYRELLAGGLGAAAFAAAYFPASGLVLWLSAIGGVVVSGLSLLVLPGVPPEVVAEEVARDDSAANMKRLEEAIGALSATLAAAKVVAEKVTQDRATEKRLEEMRRTLAAIHAYLKKPSGSAYVPLMLTLFNADTGMLAKFGRRVGSYVEIATDDLLRPRWAEGLTKTQQEVFPEGERYLEHVVKKLTDQRFDESAVADEVFQQSLKFKIGEAIPLTRKESA